MWHIENHKHNKINHEIFFIILHNLFETTSNQYLIFELKRVNICFFFVLHFLNTALVLHKCGRGNHIYMCTKRTKN